MKYTLLFLWLFLFATACNNANNTVPPTTENIVETVPNKDSLLLQSIRNTQCGLDEKELTRPFSYQLTLKGKIDNNYAIEMNLEFDTIEVWVTDPNIKSVSGSYKYENKEAKIILKGELNLNTKELSLYSKKKNEKDEVFTGKYTKDFNSFSGNWEKYSKSKKMSFELQKTFQKGANTPLWMQYVFALKLNEVLKENRGAEKVGADSVGIDKNGIYIQNLVAREASFYSFFFSGNHYYDNDARSSDNYLRVEIWTIENSETFFVYEYVFSSNSEYDDQKDEEITEESRSNKLWLYKNNKFENILVFDDEQKDADKNYSSKITNMDWYATNEKEIVTIFERKTNKSWVWDADKEKLTSK